MAQLLILLLSLSGWAFAQPPLLGLPELQTPADNPQTPAKIALGQQLFHEARLSVNGLVSCASCHAPEQAFADGLKVSEGINGLTGARNAPSVLNAAYARTQFWDGRAGSLEEQAIGPMLNPLEMGMPDETAILAVVRGDAGYRRQFRQVFDVAPEAIRIDHVAKAIASFERTLIVGAAPFDRYYFNNEQEAISQSAKRGLSVFFNQAACASCHALDGQFALFTDHRFSNIGVGFAKISARAQTIAQALEPLQALQQAELSEAERAEFGRFLVTGDPADIGAFKTPMLRNIEQTAPYMHDGSLATLEEVVDFYNRGGRDTEDAATQPDVFVDPRIRPLHLSEQQKQDLVAFMRSLTSRKPH